MAISVTAMWLLPLLLLAAIQDCIGDDSLKQHDSILVAAMKQLSQSLECFSDTMQDGLLLHKHNNEVLTSLQSVPGAVSTVNQEIIVLKSQIEKIDQKVETQMEEIQALKKLIVEKDNVVETQTEEIQELKKLLAEKDKMVGDLHTRLGEAQTHVQQLELHVSEMNETVVQLTHSNTEQKEKLSECDKKVQDLDTKLRESLLHSQLLEQQVKDLNETDKSQDGCKDMKNFPQHGRIKELVQVFSSNGDWDKMKEGLKTVLDHSSKEYSQLQSAGSVFAVGLSGFSQLVSLLLCAGMPVDMSTSNGDTLLLGAAQGGYIQLVEMLLDRGADINTESNYDITPLMCAVYGGHLDVVRLLVQAGADTTVKNYVGRTALDYARTGGSTAVVQYLEQFPH